MYVIIINQISEMDTIRLKSNITILSLGAQIWMFCFEHYNILSRTQECIYMSMKTFKF
jgi:hypothetical protein